MTIIGNAINVARSGVSVLKKNSRTLLASGTALVATASMHAQTAPVIDLGPVEDGIGAAQVAMVGIAAAIIGAGIAVGAIKWGARFGIGLFKIFGK